jgi:hypothetical protein
MSQVNRTPQFQKLEDNFFGLGRTYNLTKAINGGIDFGESTQVASGPGSAYSGNINGQWVNVQAPGTANTEFSVPHNLNRIPSHYHYIVDSAAKVYQLPNTGTAWTTDTVYLKCDTASANIRLFLM